MDSTLLVPQPATAVPPQELVTLPIALPQSFPTFEGPVLAPRAPSSTPRMRMPLPGHCYVPPPQPWSWPGRGPAFQYLNLHLYQPVPVHPGTGAAAGPFLSTVSKPPAPHPQQLTRISTTQTPSSYSPALGRIFSSQSPASLPGPAGPAAAQSQSSLTSGPLITLLPASTPALPPASSQSAVASVSAAPSRVTAPPAVQTMMQDLQVHEGPMAGDDGWCSTPAECGSLYSAEYGPQWAESWPWQSHMPLLLSGQLLAKHWFPSPSCFSFSCQLSQPFSDLNTPNVVVPEIVPLPPVVLHQRAWLGDLPGTYPCCPGAVLPRWCSDHPGTIVCPLAPGGCPLIAAAATLHLGHLHLDLVGDNVPILAVCAFGLLTGIVNDVNTRRNNSFQASWRFPCSSTGWWPRCRTDFISWRFPLVRGGSQETLWWPTLPSGLVSLCWSLPSYRPDKQSVGTLC